MTGTAVTEAAEFSNIYKLEVTEVPTNRTIDRTDNPDVVFRTETGAAPGFRAFRVLRGITHPPARRIGKEEGPSGPLPPPLPFHLTAPLSATIHICHLNTAGWKYYCTPTCSTLLMHRQVGGDGDGDQAVPQAGAPRAGGHHQRGALRGARRHAAARRHYFSCHSFPAHDNLLFLAHALRTSLVEQEFPLLSACLSSMSRKCPARRMCFQRLTGCCRLPRPNRHPVPAAERKAGERGARERDRGAERAARQRHHQHQHGRARHRHPPGRQPRLHGQGNTGLFCFRLHCSKYAMFPGLPYCLRGWDFCPVAPQTPSPWAEGLCKCGCRFLTTCLLVSAAEAARGADAGGGQPGGGAGGGAARRERQQRQQRQRRAPAPAQDLGRLAQPVPLRRVAGGRAARQGGTSHHVAA